MHAPRAGDAALTEPEALAALAWTAVCADGVIAQEEEMDLVDQLARLRAFEGARERDLRETLAKVERLSREWGENRLVEAAGAALRPDVRPSAFFVVCDIVGADGDVGPEERRLIERARAALGLDPALAERIVEVATLKNRV
ncbi:MAG TPA: tellurite resistance TerB family protein [Candidatus Thermoplasmatota archaeon]|nr:tellurite resistance TerB family protein [Candidatus Thermoplasmatota archaeon]